MDQVISYYLDNIASSSTVRVISIDGDENRANVVVEPLQGGFGVTLGNAMRRVLLSSLGGTAIESIEIDGISHEYSCLQGVKEDVNHIMLNLKKIVLRSDNVHEHVLCLHVEEAGPVTAGMIICEDEVEVVNKDLLICTLDKMSSLNIKMYANFGIGYHQAKRSKKNRISSIGRISIDSLYTPVKRVNPVIESIRVGDVTDYDRLVLEVETNGAISVEKAVGFAAKILQKQLSSFINVSDSEMIGIDVCKKEVVDRKCDPRFLQKVDELDLSVRSQNCLKNENVVYVGDLVQKTEKQMLAASNFGKKSLSEMRCTLIALGLDFGMVIDDWDMIVKIEESKNRS